MPFTLAHAAAALPFKKSHVDTSALIVGTFAPDFEYFLRLAPAGGYGHTLAGAFLLALPLALGALWLFRNVVRAPVISLLPDPVRRRLRVTLNLNAGYQGCDAVLTVGSAILGIFTHIVWDSFTHPTSWLYRHWNFLGQRFVFPGGFSVPYYKLFQHVSTALGVCLLLVWFVGWMHTTPAIQTVSTNDLPIRSKLTVLGLLVFVATAGAILRGFAGQGITAGIAGFAGKAVVTWVALIWWQLVIYGMWVRMQGRVDRRYT